MVNVSIGFSVIFYFSLLGEPAFCFRCQSSQCYQCGEVIQGPQPSRGREYFKEEKGISGNSQQVCLYPGLRQKSGRFLFQVCPSQRCNSGICISIVKVLYSCVGFGFLQPWDTPLFLWLIINGGREASAVL